MIRALLLLALAGCDGDTDARAVCVTACGLAEAPCVADCETDSCGDDFCVQGCAVYADECRQHCEENL